MPKIGFVTTLALEVQLQRLMKNVHHTISFEQNLLTESVIEAQLTVFQVELLYLNKLPLGSLLACHESSEFCSNGLRDM